MDSALVLFGFCWMIVAAVIGLLLAKRHEDTIVRLAEVSARGDLQEYFRLSDGYKWNKTVHAHSFLFPVVDVAVGLSMPRMHLAAPVGAALAAVLMLSTAVWTVGALLRNRPLMIFGDLSLLVGIAASAVGLGLAL